MDVFSSAVGQVLALIFAAIVAIFGGGIYGRMKEREGHKKGREEELQRSREAVKQVEAEMKAEVEKPRTTKETKKRLEGGTF